MPSFADSIFLFVLALLLFGPKKLPVLARELGKWMGEFRRASNEFKMQMEEELRASEQADRQKQIAAMEAAAPIPPPLNEPAEPEHPHLRHQVIEPAPEPTMLTPATAEASAAAETPLVNAGTTGAEAPDEATVLNSSPVETAPVADGARPVPIAVSGSLKMMPPATGLPTPRSSRPNAVSALVNSIPEAPAEGTSSETESVAHGN